MAAFGGTLSSYTWICLIIAFLQLRNPAVLPALHQLPHKTAKPDGTLSDFADNLKKIKGFGNKNKSSEAELLFQFFRFYAHEFDYDKHVLSVRQGKLITKQEKKWHYAMNNQLCVEEPFNTSRNLGNTADEYSFRGLHLELRRAFDLISAAKLEEACEQYVYPKEEERVWSRPASQPRPVLLRSSSQTHSSGRGGRGGHRGGRHSNNYHRSGGSNRRASSTTPTYDPNVFVQPVGMPQDMSWFAAGNQYPFPFAQQDLMQMAYQESMRQQLHHLYAQQSPAAFLSHQGLGQQRMSPNAGSSSQQSTGDRSRTNSFDTAPIGATLRPDLYALYGMSLNQQFYAQAATGYGTYPSSPVTSNGVGGQDFRRPLQRSTVTSDNGISASSSSLRSQSQPASRSPSTAHSRAAYTPGAGPSSAPGYVPRHVHGVMIPSFISDDTDLDDRSKAASDSPQSEESRSNGLLGARGSSPIRQPLPQSHSSPTANGLAFKDVVSQTSSPRRRRLSTDQLPQTILDRRMRRASRSPSPLDHSRALATGATASSPLASAPFPGVGQSQNKSPSRPVVVNGSGLKSSMIAASNQGQKDASDPEECAMAKIDNALHINAAPLANGANATDAPSGQPSLAPAPPLPPITADRHPVIVNGSSHHKLANPSTEDASFRDRIAMMSSYQTSAFGMPQDVLQANGMTRLPPSTKQRLMSRQAQNGVIAPLDLAITDHRKSMIAEIAHLSPVYETQISSPTALRKPDVSGTTTTGKAEAKTAREDATKAAAKVDDAKPQPAQESQKPAKAQKPASQNQRNNTPRENGHVRSAKSESDGGWQKAGKGKKKGASGLAAPATHAEQLPKSDSERKGG